MTTKDQVLNVRIASADLAMLKEAAEIEGLSTSAFVTRAALREAGPLIARADRTVLPAATFDALIESLDTPDAAPRLREAFARHGA